MYKGKWIDDKCHGKGILKYANGDEYSGKWKDCKHHGQGKIYSKYDEHTGVWKDDKEYDEYTGEWKDDCHSTPTIPNNIIDFQQASSVCQGMVIVPEMSAWIKGDVKQRIAISVLAASSRVIFYGSIEGGIQFTLRSWLRVLS